MIGPRVRILAGVAAAVFAVVLLLEDGSDSVPAERLATGGAHDAPAALAADASARLAPAPGGVAAPSPAPTVAPSSGHPTARPAGGGIRGRIDFSGALPSGLVLRFTRVPVGLLPGAGPRAPVDVAVAPDGTFLAPPSEGEAVRFHVSWNGGSAEVRRDPSARDARELVIRLGSGRLEGRILDAEGRPLSGVYIRDDFRGGRFAEATGIREAVSDDAGSWRLDHLPQGRHGIQAVRPVGAHRDGDVRWDTVDLAEGEHRTLELGVASGDAIWTGRLRRRGGGPLLAPGSLFLTNAHSSLRCPYDLEGRFRIAAAPGPYKVEVEPRSPRRDFVLDLPTDLRPITTPPAPRDTILLRNHLEADVVLVGGAVSGRMLAEGPAPVNVGLVAFRPFPPDSSEPPEHLTACVEVVGEDRRFASVALPPARYLVAGLRRGHFVALVGPDGQPVVVDVVDGGEITGLELKVASP